MQLKRLFTDSKCRGDGEKQRIGPIAPVLLQVDQFEPILDTNKSTVAATGINQIKSTLINRISEV